MSDHIPIDLQDDIDITLKCLIKRLDKANKIINDIHQSALLVNQITANTVQNHYSALFNCIFSIQESGSMQIVLHGNHFIVEWGLSMHDGEPKQAITFMPDPSFEIDQEEVDAEVEE